MKKLKLILFNNKDIFVSNETKSLISTTFTGVNPLTDIDLELQKYGLSKDSSITYLGTVGNTYILSVEVNDIFTSDVLSKVLLDDQLDEYAVNNLDDYSAVSLFLIKKLSVKNIIKEE